MTRAVHLRHVVALTGRFPALAGVDLSLERGEVVVLVGPNGAGKTSLLRVCAGLLPVTDGEAVVLGCDLMRERSSVRRLVGMLGHAPAVYEDLTVKENVRFAMRAAGSGSDGDVAAALDRVGLVGRLARSPASRLSAGQRKRIALAVLVARRLPLWLLDEPHAGLDAAARSLLDEMVTEAASSGTAVILVSHELSVSAPLADRVVQMAGGRVVSDKVLSRPSMSATDGSLVAGLPLPSLPSLPSLPATPAAGDEDRRTAPASRDPQLKQARGGAHVA
jgi:heme ABC exporter ATP-binding subunit CcmA